MSDAVRRGAGAVLAICGLWASCSGRMPESEEARSKRRWDEVVWQARFSNGEASLSDRPLDPIEKQYPLPLSVGAALLGAVLLLAPGKEAPPPPNA